MLEYGTLLDEALNKLPDFKKEYNKLISEDEIDKESGNHIVFGYAFVPVIVKAIKEENTITRDAMFGFLEQMASSDDIKVVEVCDQSVLEALYGEFDEKTILPYMGKKTKEGFMAVKEYMY